MACRGIGTGCNGRIGVGFRGVKRRYRKRNNTIVATYSNRLQQPSRYHKKPIGTLQQGASSFVGRRVASD